METTTTLGTAHDSSSATTETLPICHAQSAQLPVNVQASLISCMMVHSVDASCLLTLHAISQAAVHLPALKNQQKVHHRYLLKSGHVTDVELEMNATHKTANFVVIATTHRPIISGADESFQTTLSFQSLEKLSKASAIAIFGGIQR